MAFWGSHYRHVVLAVGFICLSSVCSNYIVINFTFICMKNDFTDAVLVNNTEKSIYDYTSNEKKAIMWAVAAGTMIGTIPVNILYVRVGARIPFLLAGVLSAISTVLIPMAAQKGMIYLLVLRFLQGVAYSADFAAIGLMTVRWAPLKETAVFIAILTSFTTLSSTATNALTGLICESSLGWKWAYYLHSGVCIVMFTLWGIVYVDDPESHKRVSQKEIAKIRKNKSAAELDKNNKVPYFKIITSPVVLCVWLSAFVEMSSGILFVTYAPIYFNQVLKFGVAETGYWVAFVMGINLPLKLASAVASDRITCVSERTKLYFFNTCAVGVVGVFYGIVGYIPAERKHLALVIFVILKCFYSFNCGGFYKCGTLHARQFSHVVIAAIQWMKCVALVTAPALVAFFVNEETDREQWKNVFLSCSIFMLFANTMAYIFFTDQPASWTQGDDAVKKDEKPVKNGDYKLVPVENKA